MINYVGYSDFQLIHFIIDYMGLYIEAFLLLYLLRKVFRPRGCFSKFAPIFWGYLLVNGLFLIVSGELSGHNFMLYLTAMSAFGALFGLIFLEGKWYLKLIVVLLYTSSVVLTESVVMNFSKLLTDNYPNGYMPFWIFTIYLFCRRLLSKLILYVVVRFILRNRVNTEFHLPVSYWLSMLVVSCMAMFSVYIIKDTVRDHTISAWMGAGMSAVCLFVPLMVYYFFSNTVREYEENLTYHLLRQQLNTQKQHFEEVLGQYEDMRKLRHDLRNHVSCMDELLRQERYEELHDYFEQFGRQTALRSKAVETGNPIVNAVLTQKLEQAHAAGTPMKIHTQIPEQVGIKGTDICAVISNLCDNAIEASAEEETPQIEVELKMVKNYLSIVVSNHISRDVLKENPQLHTTKQNRKAHGLGLGIVRTIVRHYDGICAFKMENGAFIASILLKNR